jgi:sugar phosphate isomerase/epimerase
VGVRFSCSDYTWPVLGHRTALAVIKDLGFAAVDVGLFADATHLTLSSVRPDPRARGRRLREDVDAAGLEVADVFLTSSLELGRVTPTSRVDGDVAELRDIFRATVELTDELGAPGITLLPGVVDEGRSADEAIALAAEGLAPLVEMGGERGLRVSVEPHFGSCIETPEATALLLEQCPGLMVTLDPSHFAYVGCSTEQMTALAPRTGHVQIRPGGPGVMQSKVADNQIDLGLLFRSLRDAGYDGWIAAEYVWMSKWRCDEVDNTGESKRLLELMSGLAAEVWT